MIGKLLQNITQRAINQRLKLTHYLKNQTDQLQHYYNYWYPLPQQYYYYPCQLLQQNTRLTTRPKLEKESEM